jgi:hypothetical protein
VIDKAFQLSKMQAYAIAADSDISAERFEIVEDSVLKRELCGTVYGVRVCTSKGHRFKTFDEARENASLFVIECASAVSESKP